MPNWVMEQILRQFCFGSCERINMEKSKVHISKNIDSVVARYLSSLIGIPLTCGLGAYLCAPLFRK